MAADLDLKPPRAVRIGFVVLIVLLHLALLYGLMRALAPDLTTRTVDRALSVFTVTVTTPEPPAKPPAEPEPRPDEGAAGAEGRKAEPREAVAPKAAIPIAKAPALPVAAQGTQDSSGAKQTGAGTGAGGEGAGPGSGRGGDGRGGMPAKGVEKIAGDINSARDYPRKTREQRIGHSVTVLLAVGIDGRVADCRVTEPSPDPEADAITCRLASERFRFRPATDAAGNPVPGKYAWRQRWFY
jgi:protein TonB